MLHSMDDFSIVALDKKKGIPRCLPFADKAYTVHMPLRSRPIARKEIEPKEARTKIHRKQRTRKTRAMNAETKGNSGKSATLRMWRRYLPWVLVLVIVNAIAVKIMYSMMGNYTSEEKFETIIVKEDHQDIVHNYLTLIGLDVGSRALRKSGQGRYGKVEATFCEINWDLQTQNPSVVPMFKDLQGNSKQCKSTNTVMADFYDLVQSAKAFDGFVDGKFQPKDNGNVFPPNGVVFHETRCGSTLFANLMASFIPGRSRTYSESPPPPRVLGACSRGYGNDCDQDLHHELIRDVFYMMGRRPPLTKKNESNYLFFKLQSVNAMNIDKYVLFVFSFR